MELLLGCARARFDSPSSDCPNAPSTGRRSSSMAMRHRVLPILYQQLESGVDGVPASVGELRDLYLRMPHAISPVRAELLRLRGSC